MGIYTCIPRREAPWWVCYTCIPRREAPWWVMYPMLYPVGPRISPVSLSEIPWEQGRLMLPFLSER